MQQQKKDHQIKIFKEQVLLIKINKNRFDCTDHFYFYKLV